MGPGQPRSRPCVSQGLGPGRFWGEVGVLGIAYHSGQGLCHSASGGFSPCEGRVLLGGTFGDVSLPVMPSLPALCRPQSVAQPSLRPW